MYVYVARGAAYEKFGRGVVFGVGLVVVFFCEGWREREREGGGFLGRLIVDACLVCPLMVFFCFADSSV